MTESFVLLFSFWSLFPNSMARPDVRTHRSHRVAVQQKLTEHRANNTLSRRKEDHLLKDLLFDDAGHCMIATHATKAGVRYRFSRLGLHGEARTAVLGSVSRVPPLRLSKPSSRLSKLPPWRVQVHRGLPAIRKPFELNEVRRQRLNDVAVSGL